MKSAKRLWLIPSSAGELVADIDFSGLPLMRLTIAGVDLLEPCGRSALAASGRAGERTVVGDLERTAIVSRKAADRNSTFAALTLFHNSTARAEMRKNSMPCRAR